MEITHEAFLVGLDYNISNALMLQLERIQKATQNFEQISKHILNLHEQLKPFDSYVALSSTNDYVKIKNCAKTDFIKETDNFINNWAKKYKITIEKVPNKETYYIKGYEK